METWNATMDAKWAFPHDWHRYWRLGDVEYIQSSAWVCIEEVSGSIVTVDVESDHPICRVNASVLLMAVSMNVIADWYGETFGDMEAVDDLLKRLDDGVPGFDASEYWKPLIEYQRDAMASDRLEVTIS